jgi:hypothetical protein
MVTSLKLLVLSALVALLAALGSAPTAAAAPRDDRSRPLVYVFVLDGLDGDRVRQRPMLAPYLNALLNGRQGARSTFYEELRSVMVTETNPNHVAMATGAYASRSGIPANNFAVYGRTRDEDSCPRGSLDESRPPTETSGESPSCLKAESFFEAVARSKRPGEVTTAGIFGKPKLARIFSGRDARGRFFADDLFAPCEMHGNDPSYCERVPINSATGASASRTASSWTR